MADATTAASVARALLEAAAVTLTPHDPVTFKSGLRSPVYVDGRRLIFHPAQWHIVIEAFEERIRRGPRADVIAGVESAGIPHSSALANAMRLPSVFVRKAAKTHGLGRRVEGGDVAGRHVVLVEDMVTTGSSSLSAVAALREEGARVDECLAVITYGFGEMTDAFAAAGVSLRTLTTFDSVIEAALASGRMDADEARPVREWLADPQAWAAT